MGEKKKRNSLPTSSLYGEIARVEETSSTLDTQYEQSSDLFKLVNKSKTSKSVQGLRDYLKSTRQTLPKAALTRPGHSRADKTVCSEEELKAIQKEHHQSGGLSLNKPYLKSVTDLMSPTTKSTKSEKRDKSESSKNGKKRERERRS